MITLTTTITQTYTKIDIDIDGGVCTPDDLVTLDYPVVDGSLGVVLSGRCPVWLFCALAHHYHPTAWVATYDPRLNGAVVVQSHNKTYKLGDVVSTTIII